MIKPHVTQYCVIFLAVCAAFVALKLAQQVFAPIFLGLVIGVVLAPFSDLIERTGLPRAISGLVTMAATLVLMVALVLALEPTVRQAVNRAPIIWNEMQTTVESVRGVINDVDEMSDDVSEAVDSAAGQAADAESTEKVARGEGAVDGPATDQAGEQPASDDGQNEGDAVKVPTVTDAITYAPSVAAQLLIIVGTLYFFLLSRHDLYDWSQRVSRHVGLAELSAAERQVSRYFLTITLINATLGVLVGGALMAIGMPLPWLWGFCAFVANFILYLGPALYLVALGVGGIVTFDGALSFLPPVIYMVLNGIEAQFVTPTLVGRAMALNPLFVFVSLVFWLWFWGPLGGIIAIPLAVWLVEIAKCFTRDEARDPAGSSGSPERLRPNRLAGSGG